MPNPVQGQDGYYVAYPTYATPVPHPFPDSSPDPSTTKPGYDEHYDVPTQSNEGHSYSRPSSGEPGWMAPVVGCLGGMILIIIIVVAVLLVRNRRRRNPNLPPIHDQMYIDYKVNKRAPLPAPRSEDNTAAQTDTLKVKTFTYDYADGKSNKNKNMRNVENSLIVRQLPHEYLDLTNSTDHGYSTVT